MHYPWIDEEFPIGPALRAYLERVSKQLGMVPERRSIRRWVFSQDGFDAVVIELDPKTNEIRIKDYRRRPW